MTVRLLLAAVAIAGCGEGGGRDASVRGDGGATAELPVDEPAPIEIERLDERRFIIEPDALIQLGIDHTAGAMAVARDPRGYRITALSSDATAARLGLVKGDLIRGVNNVELAGPARLQRAWNRARRDEAIRLLLERDGAVIEIRWIFASGVESTVASFRSSLSDRDLDSPEHARIVELARGGLEEAGLHRYRIDRAILSALATSPDLGDRRVAGVWSARGQRGVTIGSRSIYTAFGLGRLDIVKAVGAVDIATDKGLQRAVAGQAGAADLAISVVRLDEPLILRYQVVEGLIDDSAWKAALAAWRDREPGDLYGYPPRSTARPANVDGIKQTGDFSYDVDAAVIPRLSSTSPRAARIVPSVRNGKPNGFKLYAIRRGSIPAALGLKNGDTILGINGQELTTLDKALAVFRSAQKARRVVVEINRRGKSMKLTYRIKR